MVFFYPYIPGIFIDIVWTGYWPEFDYESGINFGILFIYPTISHETSL